MKLPLKLQALGVVETHRLTQVELDEIWRFYSRFVECDRGTFMTRVVATEEIGRARYMDGGLCGFWAISYVDLYYGGQHHRVIYTGLAGVDRAVRRHGLPRLGGLSCLMRQRAQYPRARLHWFFTAPTVNAYRMMARGMQEYYPTPQGGMPESYRALCAAVVERVGDSNWKMERGVVEGSQGFRYREGVVGRGAITDGDPLAQAYARLNPHQVRGDSLICICPLHAENARFLLARASQDLLAPLTGVAGRFQRRAAVDVVGPWGGGA